MYTLKQISNIHETLSHNLYSYFIWRKIRLYVFFPLFSLFLSRNAYYSLYVEKKPLRGNHDKQKFYRS